MSGPEDPAAPEQAGSGLPSGSMPIIEVHVSVDVIAHVIDDVIGRLALL